MMLVDDVGLCEREKAVVKVGMIHRGNGAVEGSLGEERGESVKSKDRVHMSEWNASRKCQCAIFQLPQVTEFKYLRRTLYSKLATET